MSCDVTGKTYNSVLTVQVVSAGVEISACLKAGELLLGTLAGVHLDSAENLQVPGSSASTAASSHHDPILEFDGTGRAGNGDDI